MKGFLSLVLLSIALLQMTAAAPTASERSQALKKREGEQNIEKRDTYFGTYKKKPSDDDDDDDDDDVALKKREGEQNVEKRDTYFGTYKKKPSDDDEDEGTPETEIKDVEKRGNGVTYKGDDDDD